MRILKISDVIIDETCFTHSPYGKNSRGGGQTDAHDVTTGVDGRPSHGLNGRGTRDALQSQLRLYVLGKVDLVEAPHRFGKIEAREFDLMQVEEPVDLLLFLFCYFVFNLLIALHNQF